ncbi:MAG: NAD(P)-binding domain-containing protein [Alphaproteobacteria bacterium]|nr:NAD(P)-binding domain-containing protein [Alphaproteobacteria bacterium]
MTQTIGILGVGHFGGYLVEGLLRAQGLRVILSPRGAAKAKELSQRHGLEIAPDNQALVDRSDVVFLATRPKDAAATVAALRWREGQRLVIFAAGIRPAVLSIGPAVGVRAMACAACAHGESTVVVHPDDPVARGVLEKLGPVLVMPSEAALEAGTVMYGYYAMLFGLMEEGERWAKAQGIPDQAARDIVAWCFRGAGTMRLHDIKEALPDIVASLATPGGLTECGLNSLRSEDGMAAWARAMDAQLRKVRGQDK